MAILMAIFARIQYAESLGLIQLTRMAGIFSANANQTNAHAQKDSWLLKENVKPKNIKHSHGITRSAPIRLTSLSCFTSDFIYYLF